MYHGNMAALLCAALHPARPPVIWGIRQSLYSLNGEKRGTAAVIRAGSCLSRYAARITYNSRTSAEQHEAFGYLPRGRVIIPNGFDTDSFAPSAEVRKRIRRDLNIPSDALVIGHIGRYHPMKDHVTLLRAAAILLRLYPSARFMLAGPQVDGHNAVLRRTLRELNLLSSVRLLGDRPTPRSLRRFRTSSPPRPARRASRMSSGRPWPAACPAR